MRVMVLATGMTALLIGAGPALALQAGAPVAQPTQSGAWGPQGWQSGATPAPAPAYTAPMAAAPAASPGFGPAPAAAMAPYTGPVSPHVYDKIARGRKVKGDAAAPVNNVADPASWGLPQPPAGMRWIRYYDEALLLDTADRTVDIRSVRWDMSRSGQGPAYAGGPTYPMSGYAGPGYPMAPMQASGTYTTRSGSVVTTTQVLPPPAMVGGYYGPYGQVVAVTPGTITTTTRTYWVRGGASRYHHAHKRCGCRR